MREDLPELIAHAESNGQITGLLTDGIRFADKTYLQKLLLTGLDHILFVYHPESPESLTALENVLNEDIFVAVHLTLTEEDTTAIRETIHNMAAQGVKAISLSAAMPELGAALVSLRNLLADLHIELVWNLPVPYSHLHPVRFEALNPPLEGAGRAWIYAEPDGDILKAQGLTAAYGNLLTDSWESIHQKLLT